MARSILLYSDSGHCFLKHALRASDSVKIRSVDARTLLLQKHAKFFPSPAHAGELTRTPQKSFSQDNAQEGTVA